jgi:hypothetical protein
MRREHRHRSSLEHRLFIRESALCVSRARSFCTKSLFKFWREENFGSRNPKYKISEKCPRALTHARQFLSRQNERKHTDVCWFALDCLSLSVCVCSFFHSREERYCSLFLSLSFGIGKTVVKLGEFNNNIINIDIDRRYKKTHLTHPLPQQI